MKDYKDIENHMLLGNFYETSEVLVDIEVYCCKCSAATEVECVIHENWPEKYTLEELDYVLSPGDIYCDDCFNKVENNLSKEAAHQAHLLSELKEGPAIELYNEDAVEDAWIDGEIDRLREERLND